MDRSRHPIHAAEVRPEIDPRMRKSGIRFQNAVPAVGIILPNSVEEDHPARRCKVPRCRHEGGRVMARRPTTVSDQRKIFFRPIGPRSRCLGRSLATVRPKVYFVWADSVAQPGTCDWRMSLSEPSLDLVIIMPVKEWPRQFWKSRVEVGAGGRCRIHRRISHVRGSLEEHRYFAEYISGRIHFLPNERVFVQQLFCPQILPISESGCFYWNVRAEIIGDCCAAGVWGRAIASINFESCLNNRQNLA